MKRLSIVMIAMLLGTVSLMARPGYTKPVDVKQPDGTTVTLLMHGDEFLNFMTTTDGYTVVKGSDGYYRYADRQDGVLTATSVVAKNPAARQADEVAFLAARQKMVQPAMTAEQRALKTSAAQLYRDGVQQAANSRRVVTLWPNINYSNFKGLVLLVEFSDRKFTMSDPQSFYKRLVNEKNLTDNTHQYYPVDVMGSVKDYFYDNSMGVFEPNFDVVGPIQINQKCTDGGQGKQTAILAAVQAADPVVDFSQYDLNNDGKIDLVYFIFAGYGSYVQGNNENYLWPHASEYWSYSRFDNKRFSRYACSVEIQDLEAYATYPGHPWLDGIGTMCHEFGHVLGLADHYDTDYETNGQSQHPGEWDVMAGGADHNYGLSPAGYNAFERHQLGFGTPQPLTVAGNYQLEAFNTSNQSFLVTSAKANEDFYLENRQKQGWDTYLPGHGLLIWRADSSTPSVWTSNQVNINPNSMCFEVVGNAAFSDIDLTAATCSQWGTKGAAIDLFDITEQEGGVSFEAGKDVYQLLVEDFEATPLTTQDATGLAGQFCSWDLAASTVVNTTADYGDGAHMVQIDRNGTVTSSALAQGLRTLKFTVQNGAQKVRFYVKVSQDGETWTQLAMKEIAKNKEAEFSLTHILAGSRLQFAMAGTSTSAVCYLDNLSVSFEKDPSGIETLHRDAAAGNRYYNLSGQRVSEGYKGLVIVNGKKVIK